jgi:hypothetical protein
MKPKENVRPKQRSLKSCTSQVAQHSADMLAHQAAADLRRQGPRSCVCGADTGPFSLRRLCRVMHLYGEGEGCTVCPLNACGVCPRVFEVLLQLVAVALREGVPGPSLQITGDLELLRSARQCITTVNGR